MRSFVVTLFPLVTLVGLGWETAGASPLSQDEAISRYIAFLKQCDTGPVDYVLGLFEKHDIVIVCERDHRDITQYDFYYSLISDRRFIEKVGHIATEIGTCTLQEYVLEFLETPGLDEAEITERLLHIYRNLSRSPLWEKYNFFDFLKRLYLLNESLENEERVALYPCDMPFEWSGMTREKYRAFEATLGQRDRVMAENVIAVFDELSAREGARKKLLVIMNYRHAFNDFTFADGLKGDNVGRYLFEAYGKRVANVWMNSYGLLPGTTDREPVLTVVQHGKWDAAFESAGNPERGFNFAGSPFGDDPFDLFPFRKHDVSYKDVFTGMVFYKPIREFKLAVNIPGLFDAAFMEEFKRRAAICGQPWSDQELREFVERFQKVLEFGPEDWGEKQKLIDRWLE
ncbi:MAG: hypothetical protein AB1486_04125 [Planctomycetota bacterium]